MGLVSLRSPIAHQFLILALVMAFIFGWATVANAQTSFEDQYGNPMASGQEAIESSDASSETSSETQSVASAGVLPDTGGSMFPFVALGALALGSTGLLMLRHNRRR